MKQVSESPAGVASQAGTGKRVVPFGIIEITEHRYTETQTGRRIHVIARILDDCKLLIVRDQYETWVGWAQGASGATSQISISINNQSTTIN